MKEAKFQPGDKVVIFNDEVNDEGIYINRRIVDAVCYYADRIAFKLKDTFDEVEEKDAITEGEAIARIQEYLTKEMSESESEEGSDTE